MISSLEAPGSTSNGAKQKRSRRLWSEDEKRRIVAEAIVPGASVAEIARRHGVNANLVFTWRRAAQAGASAATALGAATGSALGDASAAISEACTFMPIGVFGAAENGEPSLDAGPRPTTVARHRSRRITLPRQGLDERPGVIEIDLADGVRLRVDAFVNERALRRVLATLKVAS